jgi:hypothetical protein
MDTHEEAMFSFISTKLLTSYSDRWIALLTSKDITRDSIPVEVMSEVLDEMLKSLVLAKERTVDANHVLVALTARLVTIIKRNAQPEE